MGRPGRTVLREELIRLRETREYDLLLANGENASGGLGLTAKYAEQFLRDGIGVMTSGNHIWKHKEIYEYIQKQPRLLRPANYPDNAPGRGLIVHTPEHGMPVAVLNLMGRTYMESLDCPFRKADELLESVPDEVKVRIVDFHAEATSEKKALAYYLDGRVSAVFGTHTHVQTNDARILPKGTAAVTDIGMCGVTDSVLGMDPAIIIERFISRMPKRFSLAKGEPQAQGAELEVDETTGKAVSVRTWSSHSSTP